MQSAYPYMRKNRRNCVIELANRLDSVWFGARFTAGSTRIGAMKSTLGATLAGISLPDTAAQQVRLGTLWTDRPAILVFLRHYG